MPAGPAQPTEGNCAASAAGTTASTADESLRTGRAIFYILVSSEPSSTKDFVVDINAAKVPKAAASVEICRSPGVGLARLYQRTPDDSKLVQAEVCAATAKVLSVQMALQLTLIFYNIRFEREQTTCSHTDTSDVCVLGPTPKGVKSIAVYRAHGSHSSTARQVSDGTALTSTDMKGSVWDLCDPVKSAFCWIYVTLESEPVVQCSYSARSMIELMDVNLDDEAATGGKRVRSTICHEAGEFDLLSDCQAPTFGDELRKERFPFGCAFLDECATTQAALIIPACLPLHIIRRVAKELFQDETCPEIEETTGACLPLFSKDTFQITGSYHDICKPSNNGVFLSPSIHDTFKNRQSILCLSGDLYVLGRPFTSHEMLFFDPPCPSLLRKPLDTRETLMSKRMQNEKKLKRYSTRIPSCLRPAFHLAGALCWFRTFMYGCPAVEQLLGSVFAAEEEEGPGLKRFKAALAESTLGSARPRMPDLRHDAGSDDDDDDDDDDDNDDRDDSDDDSDHYVNDSDDSDEEEEERGHYHETLDSEQAEALRIKCLGLALLLAVRIGLVPGS